MSKPLPHKPPTWDESRKAFIYTADDHAVILEAELRQQQDVLADKSNESAIAQAELEKLQDEHNRLRRVIARLVTLLESENPPTSPEQLAALLRVILAVGSAN